MPSNNGKKGSTPSKNGAAKKVETPAKKSKQSTQELVKKSTPQPKSTARKPIAALPHARSRGADTRAEQAEVATALRRSQVSELYLAGHTLTSIASQLGVSPATVSHDMEWLRSQWRERANIPFEQQLDDELARLQRLERIANEALAASRNGTTKKRNVNKLVLGLKRGKSQQDVGTEVTAQGEDEEVAEMSAANRGRGKGKKSAHLQELDEGEESAHAGRPELTGTVRPVESCEEHTTSAGDPRWARQVLDVIETRAKLLGILGGDVTNNNTNVTLDWQTLIMSGGSSSLGQESAHPQNSAHGSLPGISAHTQSRVMVNSHPASNVSIPPQAVHDATDPIEARINTIMPVPGLGTVANAGGFSGPDDTPASQRVVSSLPDASEEEVANGSATNPPSSPSPTRSTTGSMRPVPTPKRHPDSEDEE